MAIAILVALSTRSAYAYVGPGAGFAVVGSFLVFLTATVSTIVALLIWPVRYLTGAMRNRHARARSKVKRFVILGLDGLDPLVAEELMDEGKLPAFSKLRETGCFKKLGTSTPPISPVAWSCFQTGSNPGKHSIFDFLTRDPRTYRPLLSSVRIKGPKRHLRIGKYRIPIGKTSISQLRKGVPFWKVLGENGIFSNILRVPITFPPENFNGLQLSAMCVPDLLGTQGTYAYYSTGVRDDAKMTNGDFFHVTEDRGIVQGELVGPENPFRNDGRALKSPFVVTLNGNSDAKFTIDGRRLKLKQGEYSDWLTIRFSAAPGIRVNGICRLLLLSTEPEFCLYVTPINIDPAKPAMPISHPAVYSTYLAKTRGSFATLGLAEDTGALNDEILDDDTFLQQCIHIERERTDMFLDALNNLDHGLCVCVFDGTDRIQHMFWRHRDDKHPAHDGNTHRRNAIEDVYIRMDKLVSETLALCDDDKTVLMVISDHGFASFRYGVDLNRWLEENGYLHVKDGSRSGKYLEDVDWSRTRAYAIGLAGIYLNLKDRESGGIVDSGEAADTLRKEIARKLTDLEDPKRNTKAVAAVHKASEVYNGPYSGDAPDLIVGYNKGYRVSWESAAGQVSEQVFHDNTKAWSGDHCIEPSLVPGLIFCNRPITAENPSLIDIGPTVLDMFGVDTPTFMDGTPMAVADARHTPGIKGQESGIRRQGDET